MEPKRCPHCTELALFSKGQYWTFPIISGVKKEICTIEMECTHCMKKSNWQWIDEESKENS